MRINQNIMAFNAYRNLSTSNTQMGKSLEKLSSGFRINRAGDDAAGLVISQDLRSQVSGLKQATRNAQDAISVVQTAEGALNEVNTMLQRMRDLAVQASNGSNSQAARSAANDEFTQLYTEITRLGSNTTFGTLNLLSGTSSANFQSGVTFQVGANASDTISLSFSGLNESGSSVAALSAQSVASAVSAAAALSAIDAAISQVSSTRGRMGAFQNRFESTINSLQVATENVSSSESRIRDTDMAAEMTSFSRNQVLQQAGTAMLSQANQLPQSVLRLLG
ncbi:MAG: flagellin [Acidimicrobiia bacterium]